jgi:hypothetical protein
MASRLRMKTEIKISKDIIDCRPEIKEHYLELSKHILKTPEAIPTIEYQEINSKTLQENFDL